MEIIKLRLDKKWYKRNSRPSVYTFKSGAYDAEDFINIYTNHFPSSGITLQYIRGLFFE